MRVSWAFDIETIFSPNYFLFLDSNDYHYNLASSQIDPQQISRVNPIMPNSLENYAFGIGTLPNGKPVRCVDERHRNKSINDSACNERE